MIKIADIEQLFVTEEEPKEECTRVAYIVTFDTGETHKGITCTCGEGCKGTDCIAHLRIGQEWQDMGEFEESLS